MRLISIDSVEHVRMCHERQLLLMSTVVYINAKTLTERVMEKKNKLKYFLFH